MAHTESQLNKIRENADIQELIVSGYIHEIQDSLELQQLIIPNEIYILCYYFYWNTVLIFVHRTNISNNWSEFAILDTVNKTVARIGLTKLKRNPFGTAFCFIPNISTYLRNKTLKNINRNIVYNAIFGFAKKTDKHNFNPYNQSRANVKFGASLLLFSQNFMFYQNDYSDNFYQNKFDFEFKSAVLKNEQDGYQQRSPKQVLFCGDNGIIFSDILNLYQLQLSDVKLKDKQKLNFKQLNPGYVSHKMRFKGNGLRLTKLSENKLFGIERMRFSETSIAPRIKCGIYDFGTNEWKLTKSYTFMPNGHSFSCATFYDKMKNRVFQTNSVDCTAMYDFHKNKWKALFEDKINKGTKFHHFNDSQKQLWIDQYQPNILYVLYQDLIKLDSSADYDASAVIRHKYCDLRVKNRKWLKCDKMKTDYLETNKFVAFSYSMFPV